MNKSEAMKLKKKKLMEHRAEVKRIQDKQSRSSEALMNRIMPNDKNTTITKYGKGGL